MASLSTLFGGGDTSGTDPQLEGLPTVCVYGGTFNQFYDVRVHRVHSGELFGSPWGSITNSTASYAHGMSTLHEFGYNSDRGQLNDNFSSQGYNNHPQFTQSLYQNDHYPYAMYGSCSPEGRLGMHSFHGSDYYQKYQARINVQSLKGKRPRRQFNLYDYKFSETDFNSTYGKKSQIDTSDYINVTGHVANTRGACVYKQDTKQLLMYYADSSGSTNGYLHLVQGTVDLMGVGHVAEFFDTATFKRFDVDNITNIGHSSTNYILTMALGDNNVAAITYRNGNTHYYKTFNLDVADGSSLTAISNDSIGNTTSYGSQQGYMYQERYQQTWDGTFGCFYSPYYYYGCGLSAFFFSIANPNKYYKVQISQSNGGGGLFPSDKKGFKWLHGQNTDSVPISSWSVDFSSIANPSDTSAETLSVGSVGMSTNEVTYNVGSSLSNSNSAQNFQYPGYYYSTSYPRFMTVNWWQQDGAYIK